MPEVSSEAQREALDKYQKAISMGNESAIKAAEVALRITLATRHEEESPAAQPETNEPCDEENPSNQDS